MGAVHSRVSGVSCDHCRCCPCFGCHGFIWLGADWQEWQNFFTNNFSWIIGLNFLGLFVLFADRVLLRYFFYRFSAQSLS